MAAKQTKITKTARDQYRRRRQIEQRAQELQAEMDKLYLRWTKLGGQIGEERLLALHKEDYPCWTGFRGPEWNDILA